MEECKNCGHVTFENPADQERYYVRKTRELRDAATAAMRKHHEEGSSIRQTGKRFGMSQSAIKYRLFHKHCDQPLNHTDPKKEAEWAAWVKRNLEEG